MYVSEDNYPEIYRVIKYTILTTEGTELPVLDQYIVGDHYEKLLPVFSDMVRNMNTAEIELLVADSDESAEFNYGTVDGYALFMFFLEFFQQGLGQSYLEHAMKQLESKFENSDEAFEYLKGLSNGVAE